MRNKLLAFVMALCLPLPAFAADAPQPDAGQKAKLEFIRVNESVSVMKVRINVNGRPLDEIGKDESARTLVDPGLALVTIDEALVPGKFQFSFTAEKGSEYLFEITSSLDEMDAEHLFGVPPKVANGKILANGGTMKATLFSARSANPPAVAPEVVAQPVATGGKVVPLAEAVPAKAPSGIKERLQMLKDLHDQGLISNEVYNDKQQKILDELK
jgi:hypothetical protein